MDSLLRFSLVRFAITAVAAAASTANVRGTPEDENERVVVMQAFKVAAGPVENFGFQIDRRGYDYPRVIAVVPNTAAAKAGLKPGDLILRSDGVELAIPSKPLDEKSWRGFYVPPEKRADMAAGNEVTWTLEVISHYQGPRHVVKLALPSPPPHWGAKVWHAPEGRTPAIVSEPGPLASRAKLVLDNGVWIMLREDLAHNLPHRSQYYCFQWSVALTRTFTVSQVRNRTDIILQSGRRYYLTSPAAVLERAVRNEHVSQLDPWLEIPPHEAQKGFQTEVDFWLHGVGKVSERWPLERLPSR